MATRTKQKNTPPNWRKDDSKWTRRQNVLNGCHGNKRLAAQVLFGFCKINNDPEIKRLAYADALHFKNLWKMETERT